MVIDKMASKKKQTGQKEKISDASQSQEIKKTNKTRVLTRRLSEYEDGSDEDEQEMERNFELFSKRNLVVEDEGGDEGEDDGEEDEGDGGEKDDDDGEDGGEDDGMESDEDHGEEDDEDDGEEDDEEDPDSSGDDSSNEGESRAEESGSSVKLNTKDDLKQELSTMSFEEIMSLQNKVGTKTYNKVAYGETKGKQAAKPLKQLSKHRPDEISAKMPVPYLRKVVPVKKTILRDPRFDDLSGEFKPQVFKQTYTFIDEIRQREAQMVKKKLKKVKSSERKEELKALLKRMENQDRARHREEQKREKELQFKKKQRELVTHGHRPFYLKKSDKKKLELAEKYTELKKSGKLENFLSKKRKRNAVKDRRKLPYQHKHS